MNWDLLIDNIKGTAVAAVIDRLPKTERPWLTEIRIRAGQPIVVRLGSQDCILSKDGLKRPGEKAEGIAPDAVARLMQVLCAHSPYAFEEQLRQGYLTLRGGHRVGVVGQASPDRGGIRSLRHVTSINIRVAREAVGCADGLLPHIAHPRLRSTIILSPPGCGKTTFLRDLARILGQHKRVALLDERGELAGCHGGLPGFNVGVMTDILDGVSKEHGIPLILRSMAPDVIIVDEIGRSNDAAALEDAVASGVTVLASAHASSTADAQRRPILRQLLASGGFERMVVLSDLHGPGTLDEVTDGAGNSVFRPGPLLRSVRDPAR